MQGKVLAPLSPFSTTMCFLLMCSLEVGYLPAQCGLSADTSVPSPLGHWGRGLQRAQWGVSSSVWWYSFFSLETLLGSETSWPASEIGAWNLGAVIGLLIPLLSSSFSPSVGCPRWTEGFTPSCECSPGLQRAP